MMDPRRSTRLLLIAVALVVLTCGGATCLYSGAGPFDPAVALEAESWNPVLRFIADLLTAPVPTAGAADVRDVVLVVATALLAVVTALVPFDLQTAGRTAAGGDAGNVAATSPTKPSENRPMAFTWLVALSACVTVLALLSAWARGEFALSAGWIIRFVCGCAWAAMIARLFTRRMIRQTVVGLLGLACITLILAFVHRSSRGLAYFDWPIGPITPTSALAGLWAALSGTVAAVQFVRHRRLNASAVMAVVVCALSLAALYVSGRRSAFVGLVGAIGVIGAVVVWRHYARRAVRIAVVTAFILALAGAGAFVAREAARPERERSGPIVLRLAYLRESAALMAAHPLLGIGPDLFVVNMTNRVAPLRAVSPHIYHGRIDPYAHNEWLQALVELGLPGGIFYALIPIGIVAGALRRWSTPQSAAPPPPALPFASWEIEPSAVSLALIAALAAVGITELGSITLRGPIMPVWYWTVLGLLAAHTHAPHCAQRGAPSPAQRAKRPMAAALVVLVVCWGAMEIVRRELSRATALPSNSVAAPDPAIAARLFAEKAIGSSSARGAWRALYDLVPGLADVPAQYARCLAAGGHRDEALRIVRKALETINPYEPAANELLADLASDPVERFRCACRALRAGALDANWKQILTRVLPDRHVRSVLAGELPDARRAAQEMDDEALRGAEVELLRVSAFDRLRNGDAEAAIADQKLAADCYLRLERASHPFRRAHGAETDAWFTLARMLYDTRPADIHSAYEAIRVAERLAVLGIRHEQVADPQPKLGYVIGEAIPTEFPERLRPLWRWSALIHLAAGDDRYLNFRVAWSLPPRQWNDEAAVSREMARLARQAHDHFSTVASGQRPPHDARLAEMAERLEKQAAGRTDRDDRR